jgi:hypothetical protein
MLRSCIALVRCIPNDERGAVLARDPAAAPLHATGPESLMTPMIQRPALWRDAMMDAAACLQKLLGRKSLRLPEAGGPRKIVGATWAWDDPWPAVAWAIFKISRAARRMGRVRSALSAGTPTRKSPAANRP